MGDACQDTDFKDIDHAISKFRDVALAGSELEIELSVEFSENGLSGSCPDIPYNDVFWCFYTAHVRSADGSVDVEAEIGRTLYDKKTGSAHRWDERGDCKVMSNVALFCEYLAVSGASGKILSDSSTLFDDVDTLEDLELGPAIFRIKSAQYVFARHLEIDKALEEFESTPFGVISRTQFYS